MRALMLLGTLAVAGTIKLPAQATVAGDSAATADLAEQIRGQGRIRVRLVNYNDLELLEPRLIEGALRFARFEPGGEPAAQSPHDGTQVMPLAEVSRIQVRKSAARKGAMIGLLVGGVTLAAVDRAGGPPRWDHSETLLFGVLGGGLGAVVGALIGAPFRSWTTVYEVPASRTR
jgi:hypothetical protein